MSESTDTETCHMTNLPHLDRVLPRLLEQPKELIGEVLQWLDLRDLLNLRTATHTLHDLVHDHEEALSSRFCGKLQRQNPVFQLCPEVHGSKRDLLHYIKLNRRYHLMTGLASLLSETIMTSISFVETSGKEQMSEWRDKKWTILQQRILPALFVLNNFLEGLKLTFALGDISFADWDDKEYENLRDVYDIDQQQMIERLKHCSVDAMIDISVSFYILRVLCKRRGMSSHTSMNFSASPRPSLKRVLVMYGLLPFPRLLGPIGKDRKDPLLASPPIDDYVWRGKYIKPPHHTHAPLQTIHHIHTGIESSPDLARLAIDRPFRDRSALAKFTDNQDIWFRAAFQVSQRKDFALYRAKVTNSTGCVEKLGLDPVNAWVKWMITKEGDPKFEVGDWRKPQVS